MVLKHLIFSQNSFGEQENLPCCFNALLCMYAVIVRHFQVVCREHSDQKPAFFLCLLEMELTYLKNVLDINIGYNLS